jgi:hypothetical protein
VPCRACVCGTRRYAKGKSPRDDVTAAGRVTLLRKYLRCPRCGDPCHPLDDRLGLAGLLSPRAERLACLAAASWSFDVAADRLDERAGVRLDGETLSRHALPAAAWRGRRRDEAAPAFPRPRAPGSS